MRMQSQTISKYSPKVYFEISHNLESSTLNKLLEGFGAKNSVLM